MNDLKFAFRQLLKNPGSFAVVVAVSEIGGRTLDDRRSLPNQLFVQRSCGRFIWI